MALSYLGLRPIRGAVGAVLPLVGAAAVVAARFMHISKAIEVAVAISCLLFVILLRLGGQRALPLCIYGACFFAAAPVKVGQLDLTDVFLLAAVAVLVLQRGSVGPAAELPRGLLVGLGLLIAGGVVGSFFEPAVSPFHSISIQIQSNFFGLSPRFGEILRLAYGTFGVLMIVRASRLTRGQLERGLEAFGLGATASVLWALAGPFNSTGRAVGLAHHPVELGWISAFAATVGIGLALSRRGAPRVIGVVTSLSGITGIAVSGTRSGAVALFAGLVFLQFGLRSVRRAAPFVLVGLVVFGIGLLGAAGETQVGARLAGNRSAELSDAGRALLRNDSFELVRQHGLTGVGLKYLFPPHNLVLGVLAATGVIGFIGLLFVVASVFRRLVTTPSRDSIAASVLAAALGLYACAWVVNFGWDRWIWVPLALVLGDATRRGSAGLMSEKQNGVGNDQHRLYR